MGDFLDVVEFVGADFQGGFPFAGDLVVVEAVVADGFRFAEDLQEVHFSPCEGEKVPVRGRR